MLELTAGGCGGPAEPENAPPPPQPAPSTCVRCTKPARIAIRANAWCLECFHRAFTSRFHKAMDPARTLSNLGLATHEGSGSQLPEHRPRGSKREVRQAAKVVLAFSGGTNSRALLELVKMTYFTAPPPPPPPPPAAAVPAPVTDSAEIGAGVAEGEDQKPQVKARQKQKQGFLRPPAFRECEVCFVDESEVEEHGEDRTSEIAQSVSSAFPEAKFTALKLSDVFDLPSTSSPTSPTSSLITSFTSSSLPSSPRPSSSSSTSPTLNATKLRSLLSPIYSPLSPTSRTSLQHSLLHTLIRTHARSSACNAEILLVGDSATRIAIKMLSAMSEGRGFSGGEEVAAHYVDRSGLVEEREREGEKPLLVVRPLALSLKKEIEFFGETIGEVRGEGEGKGALQSLGGEAAGQGEWKKMGQGEAKKRGVGALCEEFILSLDADFPSTVSTVVRTAHKLGLRSADASQKAESAEGGSGRGKDGCLCAVCGMPAQPSAQTWREAITISDLVAARAALASSSSPSLTLDVPTPGLRSSKLAPYAPSKAHLLPAPSTSNPNKATSSTSASQAETDDAALSSSSAAAVPSGPASDQPSLNLASYLCYACLLILQEPLTSSSSAKNKSKGMGATHEMELPGYVLRAAEARRRKEEEEEGMVARREIGGREGEGLRGVVEEFLLADDE
ncbi:hypothetical protein JCM11641_001223 [Rhodosporidiobolus odoratus]